MKTSLIVLMLLMTGCEQITTIEKPIGEAIIRDYWFGTKHSYHMDGKYNRFHKFSKSDIVDELDGKIKLKGKRWTTNGVIVDYMWVEDYFYYDEVYDGLRTFTKKSAKNRERLNDTSR